MTSARPQRTETWGEERGRRHVCPDSHLRGAEAAVWTRLAHGAQLQGGGWHWRPPATGLSSLSSSVLGALILGRWVFFPQHGCQELQTLILIASATEEERTPPTPAPGLAQSESQAHLCNSRADSPQCQLLRYSKSVTTTAAQTYSVSYYETKVITTQISPLPN